jgi:hypothetical protein
MDFLIDGMPKGTFNVSVLGVTEFPVYDQLVFSATGLIERSHELVIRSVNVGEQPRSFILLDSLQYTYVQIDLHSRVSR